MKKNHWLILVTFFVFAFGHFGLSFEKVFASVDDVNTKVLLHFNGAEASTVFTDESNKVWTKFGNAQISTALSEFGGASGYFDGSGDYLRTPYTADFNLSGGTFTIDAWFYSTSFSTAQVIISKDTYGSNYDWSLNLVNSTTLRLSTNGTSSSLTATVPTMAVNTWYHVAFVQYSGIVSMYLNGILYKTGILGMTNASQSYVTVGCAGWNSPNSFFNGYIDELRVSNGVARWTSNFTPPNDEYGVYVPPSPHVGIVDDSYSKVLMHNNGVAGSNTFLDESNRIWIPAGNAQISTSVYKFGGSSGYFSGSPNYLITPYTTDFDLSVGDFTMEAWFNSSSFATVQYLISKDTYGSTYDWGIGIINNTTLRLMTNRANSSIAFTVPTMNINTWYHVALVKASGIVKLYLNGTSYSAGGALSITNESRSYVTIGCAGWNSPNSFFKGYIDEIRFTKGLARWTSNFTPLEREYIYNVVPTIANLQINGGTGSINLNANTVTPIVCSLTVSDGDGFGDIQSVQATLYRTGVGVAAQDDINNHYTLVGNSQCIPSNGSGQGEDYSCNFQVYYLAEATDVGSSYSDDNWSCTVTASDVISISSPVTVTSEMNTLTGVDVTTNINYGALVPGVDTGGSNIKTVISNGGNNTIDLGLISKTGC